ncbi:hypothetical protein [Dactylosporangium sp. NPDC049140]|uniref:hypothetical protein n=1 Tax=Dactylosporangium sp. NPDC049140 TaxID=3155647 RepID=UPI0033D917B5
MGAANARVDSHGHPEAATVLEIDGRAPAAARADDDHFRRLASQGLDALEINGQQRLKHRSLPLSQRPRVHANDHPISDGGQHPLLPLFGAIRSGHAAPLPRNPARDAPPQAS